MDHSNSLCSEYAKQVRWVFKGEPYLCSEFLAAIEPAGALQQDRFIYDLVPERLRDETRAT
jgi:hypothetical protein